MLATSNLIRFYCGVGFVQPRFGGSKFGLDHGDAAGKLGNFVAETADFLVSLLQAQQVFDVGVHRG